MKKWWLITGLILTIVIVYSTFKMNELKVLNDWNEEETIVLQNKIWKVHFSKKVDVKTLTERNVYVTNAEGEKQKVSIAINEDKRSVSIAPPANGYDPKSDYFTLHVKGNVQSSSGRTLSKEESVRFIVKETIPVIGSKDKLQAYFKQVIKDQDSPVIKEELGDSAMQASDKAGTADSSGQNYSSTNNQVKGVDEPDIIKNDGTFVYHISENNVVITKAVPVNNMKVVSSIPYSNRAYSPQQLLLHRDRLIVIGQSFEHHSEMNKTTESTYDSKLMPAFHTMHAIVYNISDKTKPTIEREIEIEGSFISARKVNGYVYLISQFHPPFWHMNQREDEELDLRPRVRDTAVSKKEDYISYDQIRYFPNSNESNYTIISAIDLNKPEKQATHKTFLGSGNQMYMSKENLYMAVLDYPDIQNESRWPYTPDTIIYKFAARDGEIEFVASVDVKGTVLNQFSMDEYEGNFRITTTSGSSWNEKEPSYNHLFIFNKQLKLIGKVEDLAEGEKIYSARFIGNRIYIVTFKQVDPLFVIDASDPQNPVVKGELKIPGFSNYLHPYDENHIIGFGQNTKLVKNEHGGEPFIQTDGIKISIFNVEDMRNPKEIYTELIGGRGTYSLLNYDHKALLFDRSKNLFAFPIQIYKEESKEDQVMERMHFQGALVYDLTMDQGFALRADITHMNNSDSNPWEREIQRLISIKDHLYSFSHQKIVAHNMSSYEQEGEIVLP